MMKSQVLLATIICLLTISSCTVLSFYPLYTKNELIKDDRILGQWQSITHAGSSVGPSHSDTLIWNIKFKAGKWKKKVNNPFDRGAFKKPNQYTYTLKTYNKSTPEDSAEFNLHLVKLGDKTYLDFFPEDWSKNNNILAVHLMYVHTFAKIDISDKIKIQWLDSDWLQQLFHDNKIRIKYESNGAYTLLTAKPQELQKFIIKYSNHETAFSEDLQYTLAKL